MFNIFRNRTSTQTREFYKNLSRNPDRGGIWSKSNRFDPNTIRIKASVLRHISPLIEKYLSSKDNCLDLGCGPGGFLALMAPLCKKIIGADISPDFVAECTTTISNAHITNASAILLDGDNLPFANDEFDKIIMIDTIHHLEFPDQVMIEILRILKPGGVLLIFEPNKWNPLLALLSLMDFNEHGVLRLGSFAAYQKLLGKSFEVIHQEYNGVLIGPQGKASIAIADYVSSPDNRWLGWLSPKLFIAARKI
jgi:SAM-dependent methyltransferase